MNVKKFESRDYPIREALFGVNRLRVPLFQRPYAWEEDQCSDFWNDLVDDDSIFLGQFILNHENYQTEGYVDIVDGQQRTTTILILCAVFRDTAKALGYDDVASVIQDNAMVANRDFSGPQYQITVSPSLKNFFEDYIQSGEKIIDSSIVIASLTPEEARVVKNYLSLKEKLDSILEGLAPSVKIGEIKKLFELLKAAQIIVTKIEDENDAFEIFESVNATGIDLNVADLLKNFLFKKVKEERGSTAGVADKWNEIVELVSESDIDLTKFLRYYWLSKYTFVSEAKLFRAIKNTNIISWTGFLQELHENAKLLSELRNPLDTDFSSIASGEKIKLALVGLKEMNITQCYVLLLAFYRNKDKIHTNWVKVFELIENFNFTYHTISRLPANRVEKLYQEYAGKLEELLKEEKKDEAIRVGAETLIKNLENKLKSLKPSKELFVLGFIELSYKRKYLVRYVLTKIEESKGTKEFTLNHPTITIEHVLPQKPGAGWDLTPAQIKGYVHNIGNLTLLGKKPNGTVQNKSIAEKVKILKDSTEIKITQELLAEIEGGEIWNESTINDRAKKLAELAYDKVWSY